MTISASLTRVYPFHSIAGYFFYRNKRTGEVQYTKPMALGSDDLDDPKVYVAPPDYKLDPSSVRYFALVVTNQLFDASKITNLDDAVAEDHKELNTILSHPYKCKYREEDCIFLKDASLSALQNSMEAIEGKVKNAIDQIRESMPKTGELR